MHSIMYRGKWGALVGIFLLLLLSACGGGEGASVDSAPADSASNGSDVSTGPSFYSLPPEFYGAASPGLLARIHFATVVVRAMLEEDGTGVLRFKVIEYLKGTGPDQIVVDIAPSRATTYDDHEAVLFLDTVDDPEVVLFLDGQVMAAQANRSFTASADGTLPSEYFAFSGGGRQAFGGHTAGTAWPNFSWMPRTVPADVAAAQDAESNIVYIVEAESPSGEPFPTVTLEELRAKIDLIEGVSSNIPGYERCLHSMFNYNAYHRDYLKVHRTSPPSGN